jgi:putative ABC transport system permease protein
MLGRNKLRTFFMALGTLIGVTALTVVVALGQGSQQMLLDKLARMFSGSTITLMAGGMERGGPSQNTGRTALTQDDLAAIQREVPAVTAYDPEQFLGAVDVVFDGNATRTAMRGHAELAETVRNRSVTRGSHFTDQHVRASARVALVGESLVQKIFGDVDPVGQTIRIGTVPFEVLGVLETIGTDPHGIDRDNEIHIPITTMLRRVMNVDYINSAKFMVDPAADLDATVVELSEVLRRRHNLTEGEPDDFRTFTPIQVQEMVSSGRRIFTVLLPIVALISIVVGAGVVANVMLMSVSERKDEVGLRKAVGARPQDIWWQFLVESTLVTTLGGLLAIVVGFVTVRMITFHTPTAAGFPWAITIAGLGIAITVGVLAGVMPARRAAGLDPVETLR